MLEYASDNGGFALKRTFALGHNHQGLGLAVKPAAAGLAVSPDGRRLLVANIQNDSVSLIDLTTGAVAEQDLRPGAIDHKRAGEGGGSFPKAVVWTSNAKAYVASQRDREIIALTVKGQAVSVGARIKTRGQPVALTMNARGSRLYAALDNTDGVAIIDPAREWTIERVATAAPRRSCPTPRSLAAPGPTASALSPGRGARCWSPTAAKTPSRWCA